MLLSTVNLPKRLVTIVCSSKILPKFIGPFRVLHRRGNAYTIELPRRMRTHPTSYVGRLRPYHQYADSSEDGSNHPFQESLKGSCDREQSLMLNLKFLMPVPNILETAMS